MTLATVADISPEQEDAVLRLNNAHAVELSLLDADRLRAMLRQCFAARRVGVLDGFLLAFDQDSGYDSPNFLWFRARFPRFVYVDRIVVAPGARRRGLARLLYADVIGRASAAGHALVACEVNADPPNPSSDALHAQLGFKAVGSAAIRGNSKTVRYLALTLPQ